MTVGHPEAAELIGRLRAELRPDDAWVEHDATSLTWWCGPAPLRVEVVASRAIGGVLTHRVLLRMDLVQDVSAPPETVTSILNDRNRRALTAAYWFDVGERLIGTQMAHEFAGDAADGAALLSACAGLMAGDGATAAELATAVGGLAVQRAHPRAGLRATTPGWLRGLRVSMGAISAERPVDVGETDLTLTALADLGLHRVDEGTVRLVRPAEVSPGVSVDVGVEFTISAHPEAGPGWLVTGVAANPTSWSAEFVANYLNSIEPRVVSGIPAWGAWVDAGSDRLVLVTFVPAPIAVRGLSVALVGDTLNRVRHGLSGALAAAVRHGSVDAGVAAPRAV